MKLEDAKNGLVGGILAFLIAFGGVGCLVTGFRLGADLPGLAFWCLLICAAGAVGFCTRRGGWLLLGVGALAAGYLWHSQNLSQQLEALLYQLTLRYNNAYGIGVYGSPGGNIDELVGLIGSILALCVTYTVCRRKSGTLAVAAGLLPLAACLVVTDTVPEEGYLFCLIFGMTLLIMTSYLRQQNSEQGVTLTWMLAAPLALALGLLFWLNPQGDYDQQPQEIQMWLLEKVSELPDSFDDLKMDVASRLEGNPQTDDVDLTEIGPMRQYAYPVMDVVAPKNGVLYLRERDYDQYDGTGWVADEDREESFGAGENWRRTGTLTITTQRTRSQMFLPYYPDGEWELEGGALENEDDRKEYQFTLYQLPANWHNVAIGPLGSDSEIVHADKTLFSYADGRYLTLPRSSREAMVEILDGILTDEQSATQIADTIAAYVRRSAKYDLNTGRMPEGETDFALWFLRDSDTGYCVHFATATAVLLRAAGVESRYVTGYMVEVEAGETVTVTGENGHAWVEYYEPRLGAWIVLESTPGDWNPPVSESTGPTDRDESRPPETTEQTTPADAAGEEEKPAGTGLGGRLLGVLAILCGCGAALALPIRRWLELSRRRKAKQSGANAYALSLWSQAEALARQLDTAPPPELKKLAQKAKFSQHTLSEGELAELEAYVTAAVGKCRERSLPKRLLYRYVYVLY